MRLLHNIKCPKCGNDDTDRFVTVTEENDGPRYPGKRVWLVGFRCPTCQTVVKP